MEYIKIYQMNNQFNIKKAIHYYEESSRTNDRWKNAQSSTKLLINYIKYNILTECCQFFMEITHSSN